LRRSVSHDASGTGQVVVLEFDNADTATLNKVMSQALDKQLAVLLDGKVLSAPMAKAAITTGTVTFGCATAAEAEQAAAQLGASATS
jgi:preprotein translocase subunit SecD